MIKVTAIALMTSVIISGCATNNVSKIGKQSSRIEHYGSPYYYLTPENDFAFPVIEHIYSGIFINKYIYKFIIVKRSDILEKIKNNEYDENNVISGYVYGELYTKSFEPYNEHNDLIIIDNKIEVRRKNKMSTYNNIEIVNNDTVYFINTRKLINKKEYYSEKNNFFLLPIRILLTPPAIAIDIITIPISIAVGFSNYSRAWSGN